MEVVEFVVPTKHFTKTIPGEINVQVSGKRMRSNDFSCPFVVFFRGSAEYGLESREGGSCVPVSGGRRHSAGGVLGVCRDGEATERLHY